MCSYMNDYFFNNRVAPFGDLGVIAFCELTLVFVHLRPLSPSCAKASTSCPLCLTGNIYCYLIVLVRFLIIYRTSEYFFTFCFFISIALTNGFAICFLLALFSFIASQFQKIMKDFFQNLSPYQ